MSVCPGIVELTQRFNRISFWVISVILQKQTNKIRSEVVQQFIKIAKRLHDLRNMLKIILRPRKIFQLATYAFFESCPYMNTTPVINLERPRNEPNM